MTGSEAFTMPMVVLLKQGRLIRIIEIQSRVNRKVPVSEIFGRLHHVK